MVNKKVKKKVAKKVNNSKTSAKEEPTLWNDVLYDDRFLESYTGKKILTDEVTAIVELLANAWDAGATEVGISWPNGMGIKEFYIRDNGAGMSRDEFLLRWRTMSYSRKDELGDYALIPEGTDETLLNKRLAFGRNGKGRFSGFCFGVDYMVETSKHRKLNRFNVMPGDGNVPFSVKLANSGTSQNHGTRIYCPQSKPLKLDEEQICSEIGMRFLTNPNFNVLVNGKKVDFSNVDDENITIEKIEICGTEKAVELIVIDTNKTDMTTKQHGVAWHVSGRLVGNCSWKGMGRDKIIDGRRIAAKRYQFIIKADCLDDSEIIKQDWSGFDSDNELFQKVAKCVYEKIREYLLKVSEDDRKETYSKAVQKNINKLEKVGPVSREKWKIFIEQAQKECPSISEIDILKLSEILVNLEQAKSQYALVDKLAGLKSDQLDDLYQILEDWTLDIAKDILDEIGARLKLVKNIRQKVFNRKTKEVQDLQPLFKEGLWVFGPEFETIEYTSNEGMTRVIQNLYKQQKKKGSRNRPDFAVLTDGTVGLYSYPKYDDETGGEIGTDSLVIIELKKPGIRISTDEKNQCWGYVKELYEEGLLDDASKVKCYVLGENIDPQECYETTYKSGRVKVWALDFGTVLKRAESRLLKLQDRVKNAPFLQGKVNEINEFLKPFDSDSLFAKQCKYST